MTTITTTKKPTHEEAKKQVKDNYASFCRMSFKPEDKGRIVLLRNGDVVEIFEKRRDAYQRGLDLYQHPGLFSIQEIDAEPLDLGILSHVRIPN